MSPLYDLGQILKECNSEGAQLISRDLAEVSRSGRLKQISHQAKVFDRGGTTLSFIVLPLGNEV